jgi:hypothetical protein
MNEKISTGDGHEIHFEKGDPDIFDIRRASGAFGDLSLHYSTERIFIFAIASIPFGNR